MKSASFWFMFLVSLPAQAADWTATHCETFIDKLRVTQGSHGLTTVEMMVKVDQSKLDSPIAQVVVVHTRTEHSTSGNPPDQYGWKETPISPFFGAKDYFTYSLVTGHDWLTAYEELVFFVKTQKGTRYFINAANTPGMNFAWDSEAVRNLYMVKVNGQWTYRQGNLNIVSWDGRTVTQTADYPNDLAQLYNPNRCR